MNTTNLFDKYAGIIADLPPDFASAKPLPSSLKIGGDVKHEAYYAPFDHINDQARVMLVGITPDRAQAVAALGTAR